MASNENKIDVSKGISHLQHLEDLVLINGFDGADLAIDTIEKIIDKIKSDTDDIVVAEKVDGAMSLFAGKTPDGKFFISTKSILAQNQKIAYSLADIQRLWDGEISTKLSFAFKYLKPAFRSRDICIQADLLFSNRTDKSSIEEDGQKYITFQPNTLLYAIPQDKKSDLFKSIRQAHFGIVAHGAYQTSFLPNERIDLSRLQKSEVIRISEELDKDKNIFCIHPFVDDLSILNDANSEIEEINELLASIESVLQGLDEDFNDAWVENSDANMKKVKLLITQFVNQQVRHSYDEDTIFSSKDEKEFIKTFLKKLKLFINQKGIQEQANLKTSAGRERKSQAYSELNQWVKNYEETFDPMLRAYFRLLSVKNILIRLFDRIEKKLGKTFVVDRKNDFNIQAVKPEGYVILNAPHMVKLVDRLEFSRNNFMYNRFSEDKDMKEGSLGSSESIGDNKRIYPPMPDSIADAVAEEVLNSMKSVKQLYSGFNDEEVINTANKFKNYSIILPGRMQPPTKVHVDNIQNLSKIFNNVYVFLSDSQRKDKKYILNNPLPNDCRKRILESDEDIQNLTNVKIESGPTNLVFGLNTEEKEETLRKLFDIPEEDTLIIGVGKEDNRYHKIDKSKRFFNLNNGEEPTEETPHGLYGLDLVKKDGEKISAANVRDLISKNKIDEAKEIMAGSNNMKGEAVEKIQEIQNGNINQKDNDEYFNIEEFDINEDISLSLSEHFKINQEEAMDLIFEILERK